MNFSVRGRRAFTLVELLVVIAIIGVLVALLLPAVQAAREAARRSQCSNNLRQIGIAVHNFHDIYLRLPPSGGPDRPPFGTGTGNEWGSSWMVRILPYIEQGPMFDKFLFTGGSGWGGAAANNTLVAKDVQIKPYFCPSCPCDKWCVSPNSNPKIMGPSYAAIMGAWRDAFLVGTTRIYNETRQATPGGSAGCCSGGIISDGGPFRIFSEMSMAGLTDGTTNVLMVSETGNFLVNTAGTKVDYRPTQPHGFIIGWHSNAFPGNGGDNRTFNCTTIRYRINHFSRQADGLSAPPGNCGSLGVCDNASANHPLNSGHPGGVNGVLGDASVRFFGQTMPLDLLARLATRDDGLPLQLD